MRDMGLLAEILTRVAADEPSEVLVATERPLTLVCGNDMRMLAGVADDDVFAALGELLTPAQEAELIVARRVDFELVIDERTWRITAETATDEIIIRAQPQRPADGLGADEVVVIFPDAWATESRGEDIDVDIEVEEVAAPIKLPARRARGRGRTRKSATSGRQLLDTVSRGTVCFLHWGVGLGASVAREMHRSVLVIGEGDTPPSVGGALASLEEDGVVVVAVEDPSPWLAWLLRRAEEGRRVLVETRATSHEGARRILLGVDASARAEAWLDALHVTSVELRGGRWSVVA